MMGVPVTYWDDPTPTNRPDIRQALDYAEVFRFYRHFVGLTIKDIESLSIPLGVGQGHRPLSTVMRRQLIILLSMYQDCS